MKRETIIINCIRLAMRIALLFLLLTCNVKDATAQTHEWLSDDFPGSRFMDVYFIDSKYYAAVSNGALTNYQPETEYRLSLYEIIPWNNGEPGISINEIMSVPYPENYATNSIDFIPDTRQWLLAQSYVLGPGRQHYRVILCDENLTIVDEVSIDTLGYPAPFHIDSYNGTTYILGSILAPPQDELFYLKYDHSNPGHLEPIYIGQSIPKPMFFLTSMSIDPRTKNMLVFYYNGIAVLDSTLYQIKRFDHLTPIGTSDHGTVLGNGLNYYSHGARDSSWDVGIRKLVLHKYDSNFTVIKADTFGWPSQDNYPFITKSLDYSDDKIIVGGHLDGPLSNSNFNGSIKKFYLAKYDSDLHQLWYREYGGDRAYTMFGVKLLEDGGGLAYGAIRDTITNIRYAYIMHVDQYGDIITSIAFPTQTTSIKVINPGNSILQIINPDGLEARILLYELNGRELLRHDLDRGLNEIRTSTLSPALYPYTILSDGKYLSSGKWLKAAE